MFPSATIIRGGGGRYTDFDTSKTVWVTSTNCEILSDQNFGIWGK